MPPARSRASSRYRFAVLMLALTIVGLAAVLVSCPRERRTAPPQQESASARPAATPESVSTTPPEPAAGTTEPEPGTTEPERGPTVAHAPAAAPVHPAVRGQLALVIDDAGYDLADLEPFLELPMPLAVAVLPNLPNSAAAARRVREAGKDLLLHLPLEPEGEEDPGPGALLTSHSAADIERLLDAALASVPGAVGVNNHMGSKATADRAFMDVLLDALDRRGLFFVDSRTTAQTVAGTEAERLGVPYLSRKVFLDAVDGDIEGSLAQAMEVAERTGVAVAIGHVQTDGLAAILRRATDRMGRSGVRPAKISALIAGREGRAAE